MTHYHVCGSSEFSEQEICRTREQAEKSLEVLKAGDRANRLRLGKEGPGEEYYIQECDNPGCERRYFAPLPEGGLQMRYKRPPTWVAVRRTYDRGRKGG
jgi:hypothetical protein